MRDRDVRQALRAKVFAQYRDDPDTLIIDELGLCWGEARVDIAVVNGRLHGYEIKSEQDTLERLPAQMEIYNAALDRVTIVAGAHHLEKVLEMVPEWWGIKKASSGPRHAVHLEQIRLPKDNPTLKAVEMARLLWRDEALRLLEEIGAAAGIRSKGREALYQRLAERVPIDVLRAKVRHCLKTRTGWRSDALRT